MDWLESRIDESTTVKRFAAFSTDTVFNAVGALPGGTGGQKPKPIKIDNLEFMITPKRLHTFKRNCACIKCGAEGNVFLVERHNNETSMQYVNLYSLHKGGMAMITVDHILPDCLGGKYSPKNFQTMCSACNGAKGNLMSQEEIDDIRADPDNYAKEWYNREFLGLMLDLQELMLKAKSKKIREGWNEIFNRFRLRVKATSAESHVKMMIHNLKQAIANHHLVVLAGGKTCSSNVVRAKARGSMKVSWSVRVKRWFASIAAGLALFETVPFHSWYAAQFPGSNESGQLA